MNCVLLADRDHGLREGVRGLLESVFPAVVMVADEMSLFESAERLQPALAVIDLSLLRGHGLQWLTRFRESCPGAKLILLSVHDEFSACRATLAAGANGYVLKRDIGMELLPAVDAVMAGETFVSAGMTGAPSPRDRGGED